uniref:UBC core domain-containing protein n=1 Tax=Plectus sambesii TaxID=2011161 RepID=A0A914XHT9_9BILA
MASTSTLSLTSLTSQKLPKVPAAVLYIEATNSLLLVGADGELTTLDSGLESSLERLFVLPEKTQLVYEPTHKAIVLIDEQHISFRRDCAGSYFLRSALTNPQDGMVHFEMTVAEATKLVSFFNNDVTVPEQLSPIIESIKSQLERARTTNLKWDTISVEGKLSDLREQFVRLLLSVRSTDSSWLLPIIAAVLERIHLQLDHPYNFDLGNDGAGLDKAVMASESARKLTFDHWPHMHYRWALPGQMAEAGFYHQPNTTGDDRVMCFTCNVCLVCWEPADEPWSEHERHSPQCPFVRGDFTQNVPSSITMGSTKAVAHGLTEPVHCVSTVSQCDWLAVATLTGQLQLWRMDRVVQALQNFTVDLDDPYIGMKTGYMFEPRRPQRVTWSDDALEPHVLLAEATGEKHATSPGKRTLNEPRVAGAIPPQPDDLRVTALCCCNRPTKQAKAVEPGWEAPAVCSPALIVGIGLDDWRLRSPSGTWSRASSAEVDALNTMNAAPAPRIDGGVKRYRPFLIAYKIDENASRAETAERGAKNAPGSKGTKRRGANADGKAATSLSESLGIGESTQLVVPMVDDHELSMTGASDQDMDDELMLVPAEEEHWEDEAAVLESISQTVGGFGPPDLMMSGGFGSSASFGSGLATPPMGHAMMMTSVGGKSADALKPQSDLVQIQCEPPLAQLLVLQCFRLPASVDQPGMQVDKIVPACDGCSVVVVVNRVEDTSDPTVVTAALLVYRLSFSGLMTGLQEQPLREHLFKGHGAQIGACALLPAELLGRDALDAEVPDAFAFVNALGELRAVDLNDGRILYAGEKEHLVDVTLVADSKLCVVDKDGVIRLLQLTAPLMQMEDTFEAVLRGDASDRDASLLAHQPMTAASLRRMWELTRSEMTSSQSATTSGSSPGFAALVPSCWSEVQQHQRFRKNPQHYLRDERHTKSWHLQPDGVQSSKAHVFELSLLAGQRVSHLDVRFVFHPSCMGCPDIQVTLLRRRAKTERSPPSSGTFADLKAFAEVVAGPYRLGDWQDLAESGALVQIACSALQSDRQRHFYVHIEALSDESDSQKAWKARVEEEDRNNPTADGKSMTTSMTSVNRSAPMPMAHPTPVGFNADTKHPAFLFQSGIGRGFSVSAGRGTSAKLPASYGDDEAYSSKIPKLPPIAPKKPPDERKGCDWIEEVSITIWRCKKTSDAKEKLQRAAMLLSTELHEELVRVASAADASFAKTASQTLFYQHLAIDVLLWLLDHWSSASSLDLLLNVRQLVGGHFKTILTNSFFRAPRSIAHKWSAVFAELFRSLKVYDFDSYMELVGDLADSLSKELPGVYGVRSAGSLTWLFALVARLIRADPLGAGQPLLQACVHTLATVGRFWVKAQNPTHAKLLTKYRLSGLPLELLMYDWPSPALGVWQRAAIHPPAQFGLVDGHPTAMPSTAYTASELSQDEMDWAEMLNVSVGDNQIATSSSMTASSYNPYSATAAINPFTGAVVPQMGIGRKQRQRYLLGREHLCGLLEVEPLTFSCQSASDNVRVENLETGLSVAIGGRPLCSGMGAGPIPLPDMAHGDDGMHQSNPALAHAVSSMNQQVQSILSKQMQLLALQQQRQKLQGQLNDQTGGMPAVDASITPATQGSSASTFGVPTTPKTTPFMTPTPLSPSQLSPINSETNLSTFTDGLSNDAKESTNALNTSSISLMPQDLLKPPPAQMLCVDRMNAGARKFVVLDFGVPIMLTDVLIPACAEIGSICIDVWLRGESVDGQRLLVSNEIDRKSVAITDLQPLMLCRYIKMTYIGRQGLNSCSCRIPLGSFFGHRFFSAWQLFACGAASSSSSLADDLTVATSPTTAATVSLRHLRQLSEDLRCRHQLAAAELRQLVKEDQDDATVRQVYRECSQLRLQWNIVRGVVERLESDGKSLQTTDSFLDYKSWSDCCFDQLRVVADVLMTSLVQATPYVAIAPPPTVSSAFRFLPPLVDLQSAVQHFHDYCTQGFPRLQVLCSTWLFQHGCTASWWGQFFPTILERFFSTPDKKGNDRLFLLVSYLCDQTVKCGNAQVIAELLVLVDRLLHDNVQRPLDTTLLTWTLLLLSSAYDVALGHKRRSDRWAFLAGENAASTSDSHSHGYISRASQIRRPIGSSSKQGKPPKPPAKWISDSSQLVKWRDSSSSSKAPSSAARKAERAARKRHRSRGIRLKLSHELCLSVASGLIRLLTVGGDQLPTPGKLVACKVIAKTCANASVTVIPLVAALGGDTEKLLKLGVDARQSPWMRHAVLCLLLDVTDAEHRAVLRAQTVVSSLQPPPPPPPPMVHVQMTSSSGTVPPSAVGETGAFGGSDKDKDKEKDKDSAGSTPGSSTVPTTSASSPTSTSSDTLTQTSDDATTSASGNPATAADAQAKIDAALLKIDPIDLPGSAVDKETRTKMLWALCKELIHTHLNNGEAFSNMDSWLASAKNTEKTLAAQSKNPELYKVRMQKYISMQSSGKYMNLLVGMSDMMQNSVVAMGGAGSASTSSGGYGAGTFNDWSPMSSSLGALPFPVDPFGMSDALPPPGGFYSWGHTSSMGSSNTTLPSSSPGAYAEAKEKLSKLCEHLQMSNNASATTPISSLSFLPSTASGGVPITGSGTDMGGLLVGLDETALTANVGGSNADDASASGAESVNGGSPDPEGSLSGSVSGDYRQPTGAEALYAFHQLQIEVDARVQGEAVAVQPASTTSDERLEAQLGWRALTECRKWMLLGDTLTRLALKNLTPLGKIAKEKSSRSGGDEMLLLQSATGGSLETLMEAISGLIERIDDGAAADYVERLLSFYWDLLAGVGKQRKTIPTDVLPLKGLTHSAINALVNYATTANDLSEHLWTMVLKALESALRCSPPLTMTLIQSDKFTDLLMRFICQSGGKFNSSSSAGPAMVNTFGEFLQRLHTNAADNTTILCEKIVVTLTRIFSEGFGIGYAPYPVDVLLKVVETIRVWVLAYARLSESTVAELVAVVCRFLRAFMTGNSPVKQATAGVGVRPDLCFQTTVSAELASSLTATAAHSIEPTTGQASVIVEGSGLGNKGLIDRHEGLLCALLAEVVRLCNIPAAAAHVIATQPQAVNDLLAVLAVCACANDTLALDGLLTSDAEKYQPTSVADWALWTLLAIAKNVSVIDSDHLLELVVEFLSANSRETSTGAALSAPLVYAIVNIVDNHSKQETFSRLGGHVLVSKQLLACVEATTSDWSSATYSPILRQLASLSSQVAGAEPTSPKRPSDVKVDGMINFAPIAQIASSSPMAHHLNSLLPSTPPHRRARTATWTYHFYPAECWLDLTLTLPYQILLQEVQIRPHVPTLNTGPGAVQVELGSDPYATSLSVLGPPVATVGYSKIRISTAQYPYPVQTVRIHLKRPPDSSNLGLSQILLLGSSSSNALAASITLGSDFVHWLTILDRLSGSAPSVWSYAPTLPGALVSLFLTQPLTVDVYSRVAAVLTRFDARSVDDVTIVFLILQHIVAGRSVTEDVLPWLADLLLTFCSPSPTHSVELAGRRQKQLVEGVVRLLDVGRSSHIVAQQSAATVIVWSTACVLWTNQNDSTMRKSTAAAVGAVDTFVDILANVAKNYSQNEESLRDACSWALCSVGRLGDDRLDKLLKSIGINMNKKEDGMMAEFDKASLFNESNLSVIAKAAQSATVSGRLKNNGFLKALVDSVVKACTAQGNRCDDDVMSAVNCLAELAAVDLVADYLDTEGSLLFDALLRFIVANANALGNSAATRRPSLLESASINLFKRCLAYGGGHRERFSAIVSELLKESEGGLNSALQQIVLCTLLEDEQIDVVIEGASDGTAGSDNDFTKPWHS